MKFISFKVVCNHGQSGQIHTPYPQNEIISLLGVKELWVKKTLKKWNHLELKGYKLRQIRQIWHMYPQNVSWVYARMKRTISLIISLSLIWESFSVLFIHKYCLALIMGSGIRSPMRVQGWLKGSEYKHVMFYLTFLVAFWRENSNFVHYSNCISVSEKSFNAWPWGGAASVRVVF